MRYSKRTQPHGPKPNRKAVRALNGLPVNRPIDIIEEFRFAGAASPRKNEPHTAMNLIEPSLLVGKTEHSPRASPPGGCQPLLAPRTGKGSPFLLRPPRDPSGPALLPGGGMSLSYRSNGRTSEQAHRRHPSDHHSRRARAQPQEHRPRHSA